MRRTLPAFVAAAFVVVLVALEAPVARGYNITRILADHPEFSTFNHYLTVTRMANEINRRLTITVLVVDNSGMADLLARHFSILTLRNVLALHVLTDYYGSKKLHQLTHGSTLASSVFQSSGRAIGTTGYINITEHSKGRVTFFSEDAGGAPPVTFVKSIKEMPYNLSILQVSSIMSSPEAEAPVAPPAAVNLTELMSSKGCLEFANLLLATPEVLKSFESNLDAGLTVFCPIDSAVRAFADKYKNLTAPGKASLLLYHGTPFYYSQQLLKTNNGAFTTLATDTHNTKYKYTVGSDGEAITVKTHLVTATITSTLIDQDPVAVYAVDKVLQPRELFKPEDASDAPAAAPSASKKHKHGAADAVAGPNDAPSDEAAADNAAFRAGSSGRWLSASAAAMAALVLAV
ncbi:fasciclin-like arabinogalactan protein 2 [Curcuma longa]|uniref:fasciclin-like arabinogalactan protein 2 n=1 Tax=Curcuma longa TaxID=136217 RepID=UPI003D9E82D3